MAINQTLEQTSTPPPQPQRFNQQQSVFSCVSMHVSRGVRVCVCVTHCFFYMF